MASPPSRQRPPGCVVHVARTHWVVSGVILASIGVVQWIVVKFPVAFSPRTYAITFGLAALYGLAGTLVWFGAPLGRSLSRLCCLIYLARPSLGSFLWQIMDSAEYQAYFEPDKSDPNSEARKP